MNCTPYAVVIDLSCDDIVNSEWCSVLAVKVARPFSSYKQPRKVHVTRVLQINKFSFSQAGSESLNHAQHLKTLLFDWRTCCWIHCATFSQQYVQGEVWEGRGVGERYREVGREKWRGGVGRWGGKGWVR